MDGLLCLLAAFVLPAAACLLLRCLFPDSALNREAVIRTSIREILLYRQLPDGRYVPVGVMGWRYSIQILRPSPYRRRKKALRKQRLSHGNKRRPRLFRLLKWLHQRFQPEDSTRLLSPDQDHSSPSNHPTPTTHHDHPTAP